MACRLPKRDKSEHYAIRCMPQLHKSLYLSRNGDFELGGTYKKNLVILVIGYGAMTTGHAYEAMNNTGFLDLNLIVVRK
ncbi:putative WRKY transcription factor 49 [Iris pallida]|uniref:WRKY transcription factor 49 n=1 Tax=Iris pallida TaxID=29817 RepID=A0AAX6EIB8_IRIPA|nr:putative WRKY transcription factor 49 [Iris pallida]